MMPLCSCACGRMSRIVYSSMDYETVTESGVNKHAYKGSLSIIINSSDN
jgi:hypothetical protein